MGRNTLPRGPNWSEWYAAVSMFASLATSSLSAESGAELGLALGVAVFATRMLYYILFGE